MIRIAATTISSVSPLTRRHGATPFRRPARAVPLVRTTSSGGVPGCWRNQSRPFFSWGGDGNDENGDSKKKKKGKGGEDDKKKKKKDLKEEDKKEDDKKGTTTASKKAGSEKEDTPTTPSSHSHRSVGTTTGGGGKFWGQGARVFSEDNSSSSSENTTADGSGTFSVLPSRQGLGEDSPRYPHLLALPVVHRPVFPGVITNVTLTDPATINAIEQLTSKSGSGQGYVGVFLRSDGADGVLTGDGPEGMATIVERPEVITDESQLYRVGTFAQVHRFQRGGLGLSASSLHAHMGGTGGFGGGGGGPTTTSTSGENSGSSLGDGEEGNDGVHHQLGGDNTMEEETASVLLYAHRRVDLVSVDEIGPPIDVTVKHWDKLRYVSGEDTKADDMIKALSNEVMGTIREVATASPMFREQIAQFPLRFDANDPYRLADFATTLTTGSGTEHQAVLEERDAEKRLHKALVLLNKEREVSKLQQEISAKVEEKMTEAQRRYFLTEQLKSIKKELGMEVDDKEALIEKYRKKLKEYPDIPEDVTTTIESELEKLSTLEKNSSEFNVTRSYLDWLTDIPWGVTSEENFDIRDARKILDRDHYGLDEVKDAILQFIAVGKLKGTVQGKILCLAGPPGTGKTSIAKSIAEALGREYFRFSVGGLSDVSEIKGHRRTYVGAMPGKFIQCLKSTQRQNPLVLIDEIDKLGRDFRGDPASALLEVLDPSQNSSFRDHFLDVPVDMSKVLFMCTANYLESIPGPLLDRMEVITLSGYDVPEKVAIAEQYLVPKSMKENGLLVPNVVEDEETEAGSGESSAEKSTQQEEARKKGLEPPRYVTPETVPDELTVERSAIESLVRWYCREAGVRNLAKHIDKITRKLALQIVAESEGTELTDKTKRKSETWVVSDGNLDDYVGKPIFTSDRMYEKDPLPHGIVMGLAWTSMGGSALYIETQGIRRGLDADGKRRGGGTLKVTGQLGDVMSESTQIAYTVARARLYDVDAENTYFDDSDVHMHVPEGATPKDGPSAGVTMVTAMLSLALDKPVRNDLAMTGEISLTGKVLPVGGIKEKTMAARRAGIRCLIFPGANKRDFDDIPEYLKEGLEVHYAEDYSTVYEVAFGSGSDREASP